MTADSGRMARRRTTGLAILAGLLLLACVASLMIGSRPVAPSAVWHALTAPSGSEADLIVRDLRLPRTMLGLVGGMALGVAGALMQGHTRNPLADPSLLGVTQGAAFAIALSIFTLGITDLAGYVWFGFAGALAAGAVVFAIGSAPGRGPAPLTIALAGTAMSWLLYAMTSALLLIDRQTFETFRFWRLGSIAGRDETITLQILPFVVVGLVLAMAGAAGLNALALGEDAARSLGHHVALARALGLLAVTLLTGAVVAACGPIGFVGLVVPHIARFLTGPDHRWLLPYAALLGAVMLLIADVAGRLAGPGELQVGITLALLGTPFFLALVRRRRLVRL